MPPSSPGESAATLPAMDLEHWILRIADSNTYIVERFTRVGPNSLLYRFTVEDPATRARSWAGEMTWPATSQHLCEYACHEANYALGDILRGARERDAAESRAGK